MRLSTKFWDTTEYVFYRLLWISYLSKTREYVIEDEVNLTDLFATSLFFKRCSENLKLKEEGHRQFAVMLDGKITPIKWFDLIHINQSGEHIVFGHDIGFDTTFITKNDVDIYLGYFPNYEKRRYPVDHIFKLQKRAFKYLSNQVLKLFKEKS